MSKVNIEDLNLTLSFKQKVDRYFTESEMRNYLLSGIKGRLKKEGMLGGADAASVYIKVSYYRSFSGELTPWPSKSVTRPIINWSIRVNKNGKEVDAVSKSGQVYNGGFLGNLKTDFTMDLGNNTQEAENRYLDTLADTIAQWIVDRKKTPSQ
ncbi:hypothetical protein [Pseudoteredinibacter isoporae]|uniref:Uncharacterized protein n=1 Tax=Pseudoteredinibacter isoporae TaxID=570281 RepID=A0A7X0JRT1_9GAMM|nr:hypothetical protein [Pseudoteredinibacter isoporae]MBB6521097.1 hypothetical protein [Pseudoteredinibacter isoporae]NHO86661.1 hypothetical protein [Pseudoteredinibacter isoporae]NIB24887.1 hypothetical protein [Pseudoteredinibacter isoporae]